MKYTHACDVYIFSVINRCKPAQYIVDSCDQSYCMLLIGPMLEFIPLIGPWIGRCHWHWRLESADEAREPLKTRGQASSAPARASGPHTTLTTTHELMRPCDHQHSCEASLV